MTRLRGGIATVALVSILGLWVTACSSPPEPSPTYTSVVGKTLLEARPLLPNSLKIYDLSIPILGEVGELGGYNGGKPEGLWMVVAQCPAIDAGAVAVIPTESYTGAVRAKAESGEYNSMLLECQ